MQHLFLPFLALTFLGGVVLPVQVGLNTILAKSGGTPVWAALMSFLIGSASLFAYLLLSRQSWPALQAVAGIPAYAWLGGVLGAFYVTISIIAAPKIGAAMFISLAVAGQMAAAMLLDHYGALGFPQHSIGWMRIIGALMVAGGVVLIRKF